jgi:serine/threonine protein phosphatase PrpC
MAGGGSSPLRLGIGIASVTGKRRRNEDFAGAARPSALQLDRFGQAVALADGIGGAKGGREAAETAVRGFLEGYYDKPESWGVRRAAASVIQSLNIWVNTTGRSDANLAGMGCTFSALVLRGRSAHVFHVGDSRLYRFGNGRLAAFTEDHCLDQPELRHVLYRALGMEANLRLDYANHPLALHDRFLICSDGIHGALPDSHIAAILGSGKGPIETARDLTTAALERGSTDNATALVVDVLDLPPPDQAGLSTSMASLPVLALPKSGEKIDGFALNDMVSDGRYTRLFVATDEQEGGTVVMKFPRPRAATEAAFKTAFLRESWAASRVRSPWLGAAIELPPGRQSRLYSVMPYHLGETLERRLSRRPPLTLEEGRGIALHLCKALAVLHRAGIIHRDVKPDNVIIGFDGQAKLIDLGVVRIPGLDDVAHEDIPGTASYMAPELFKGEAGDAASDLFALGVTLFRAFSGQYPYGEIEPFSHPRFGKPRSLLTLRPDLPAWLDYALERCLAVDPANRFADTMELAHTLESGPAVSPPARRRQPVYQRNPLLFWQAISALLALILLASWAMRGH